MSQSRENKKSENTKPRNLLENKPVKTETTNGKQNSVGKGTDREEGEEEEEEERAEPEDGVVTAGRTPGLGPEIITVQIPALVQYTDGLYTTTVERQSQSAAGLRMPQGFWREKLIARLKAKRTMGGKGVWVWF